MSASTRLIMSLVMRFATMAFSGLAALLLAALLAAMLSFSASSPSVNCEISPISRPATLTDNDSFLSFFLRTAGIVIFAYTATRAF